MAMPRVDSPPLMRDPPLAFRAPISSTAPQRVRGGAPTLVLGESLVLGQSLRIVGQIVGLLGLGVQHFRLDAVPDRQLHPGGHDAHCYLEVYRVVGDALDGSLQP